MWNDRQRQGVPFHENGYLRDESTYMQWYITRSIRYLSHIDTYEEYVSPI